MEKGTRERISGERFLSGRRRRTGLLIGLLLITGFTLFMTAKPLRADSRPGEGSTAPGQTAEPAPADTDQSHGGTDGVAAETAASAEIAVKEEKTEEAESGKTAKKAEIRDEAGTAEKSRAEDEAGTAEESRAEEEAGTAEESRAAEEAGILRTGEEAENSYGPETDAEKKNPENEKTAGEAEAAENAAGPRTVKKAGTAQKTTEKTEKEGTKSKATLQTDKGKDEIQDEIQDELPVEEDPPVLNISVDGEPAGQPEEGLFYAAPRQKHSFVWSADDTKGADGAERDTFSGIRRLTWVVKKVAPDGGLEEVAAYPEKDLFTASEPPASGDEVEKSGVVRAESPVEIDGVKADLCGRYRLTLKAEDFCGNRSEISVDLCFDGRGPEAVISAEGAAGIGTDSGTQYCYSAAAWKNEKINVRDEYGIHSVLVEAENASSGKKKSWTYQEKAEAGAGIAADTEGKNVSITLDDVSSLGEGRITFRVHAADIAGNVTEDLTPDRERSAVSMKKESEGRTIAWILYDNTPPAVQVKMKGGQHYRENWYYREENCGLGIRFDDEICPLRMIGIELRNEKEGTSLNRKTVTGPDGAIQSIVTLNSGRETGARPFSCSRGADISVTSKEIMALKDGKIVLTLTVEDAAGNRTDLFAGEEGGDDFLLVCQGIPVPEPGQSGDRAVFMLDTKAPIAEASMPEEGQTYSDSEIQYYYRSDNCGVKIIVRDEDEGGAVCACSISVRNEDTGKELRREISRTEDLLNEKEVILIPGEPEGTEPYRITDTVTAELTQEEVGRLGDGPVCVSVRTEDPAGNIGRNIDRCTGMSLKKEDDEGARGYFILDMTAPVVSRIETGGKAKGKKLGDRMDEAPYDDADGKFYYYNDRTVRTVFTLEEANPAQMLLSYLRDGTKVEEKVSPAAEAGSGEAGEKTIKLPCSYGGNDSGKAPEGRYSKICVAGTDRAGNPLRLKKDDAGKIICRYTGEGKNEVDAAAESTDSGKGVITLQYGKVIDRTAPVADLLYSTGSSVWLYDSINRADGDPETDAENYSIATAYLNDGFTVSVKITDRYKGADKKEYGVVLDPDRLTVEQFGEMYKKADPGRGIRKDGSFSWIFETAKDKENSTDGQYYYKVLGTDRAGNGVTVREGFRPDVQRKLMPVEEIYETKNCGRTYRAKFRLMLDTRPPRFTFYMADPQTGETTDGTTVYYGSRTKTLEGTFAVEDIHLDPGRLKAGFVSRDEKEISRYDRTELHWKEINLEKAVFQKAGKTFSAKVRSGREGIYRFAVCGMDKAGNLLVQSEEEKKKTGFRATVKVGTDGAGDPATGAGCYWTMHKVLDRTAPTGVLEIGNGKTCYYHVDLGKGGINTLSEGGNRYDPYRSERRAVISVSSEDLSPVNLHWKVISSVSGKDRDFSNGKYLDDHHQKESVVGEQIFFVRGLTLTDRAGNRSGFIKAHYTDANKIYLDVTPPAGEDINRPVAAVTASGKITKSSADGRDLFNHGIDLRIRVIDPNENVRSAGLEHVTITVRADGNRVLRQTISGSQSLDGRKFHTGRAPLYGVQTLDHSYAKTLHLAAGGIYETNDIEVEVTAADNAGNIADPVRYMCGIDTSGPVITVRYDNNNARNDMYFKEARHATIEVKDRNVDEDKIHISTQGRSGRGFQNVRHIGNGGEDLWQKEISYTEDGDYTLEVSGTDALGNRAEVHYEGTAPKKFTIDRTPPVVSILFDVRDGYRRSRYFPCARTGTVVITDRNFVPRDARIHVEGSIRTSAGTAEVSPEAEEWTNSGDKSTRAYLFAEDGDYSLSVECRDLAGNESVRCEAEPFTVDLTKPEIVIEDGSVCRGGVYTDTIAPGFRFSDNNYNPEYVTLTLKGVKGSSAAALPREVMLEDGTGFGGWIRYGNFPARRGLDDLYTVYGKITDLAGNTAKLTFSFSVNRFGSTYDYNHDAVTESYVHAYKQEGMDLYLREINVSELASYNVYLSWNTEFSRLTEGRDYEVTVIHDLDTFSGNVYLYRIFSKNFQREGQYDITVQSVDRAGNRNSNSGVRTDQNTEDTVPLSFVIDRSNPTVSLRGVDLRKLYWKQDSLEVEILPEDNVRLARVNVYLDDRLVGTWIDSRSDCNRREGEHSLTSTLEDNKGSIPFLFRQSIHPQHLHVEAVDAAGNRSSRTEEMVDWSPVVHASAFVQYYNRKPVFYGSLILAGLLFLAFLYRRRLLAAFLKRKEKRE